MTCSDCTPVIVEMARGALGDAVSGEARAHLRTCSRCRNRLAHERSLSSSLRRLSDHARAETPSAGVEASLRLAFEAERMRPHEHGASCATAKNVPWSRGLAAAAALVLLTGSLLIWQRHELTRLPPPEPNQIENDFVEWPGAASLPAFESGQLVRTELPASVLPLLGIVPGREITTDTVTADVIVGQDGLARAVRLAPVSADYAHPAADSH